VILKIREFLRNESVGVVVPVAFIVFYAGYNLILGIVGGFFLPIALRTFRGADDDAYRLSFHLASISFDATALFYYGVALILLMPVVYLLFIRAVPGDDEPAWGMRECPECKSEIVVDARRCPFCTSVVAPIVEDRNGEVQAKTE